VFRGWKLVGTVVGAVSLLTVFGCGSSASKSASNTGNTQSTSASTQASPAGNAPAGQASGTPIVVGGVCGPPSTGFSGATQGAAARFAAINKAGGVYGRPIELKGVLNDNRDITTDGTLQQQLIQNDHVMAIVPMCGQDQGSAFNAANAAGIPVFGWGPASIGFCSDTNMLSINGCNIDVHEGDGSWLIPLMIATHHWDANTHMVTPAGLKVCIPANSGPGNGFEMAVIHSAQGIGLTVVGPEAVMPITTTDYTPYARQIIQSGCPITDQFDGSSTAVALTAALRAAGYKGAIQDFQTYDASQLSSNANFRAAIQGEYVLLEYPTAQDNTPAVIQEAKDLADYGWTQGITTGVDIPYWMADMFIAALKQVGPDPTSAKIAALGTNWTYSPTLQGGDGPVSYPAMRDAPSGCGSLVQAQGNKFVSVLKYHCYGGITEKA
jgi:ABC-type branched-subunit amino acid transport system substrate-binding protein